MITRLLKGMQRYRTKEIRVGRRRLSAIVADTPTKRMIGLMHRDRLNPGTCMLFILGFPSREGIWMRNMHFPIDVLWLDRDTKIVDTAEGIKPATGIDFKTYYPKSDATYVIELPAGFIRTNRITKSSKIYI